MHIQKMIENYRKLMYYAIITVVLFCCVQQFVTYDSFMENFLVNYTVKRYLFEQSAVREFYSGAYYDLFLVMRGSGVFRCSEVVLPAQQQNLIIFKPGQGGRLEYAGAYGPLELIRVQLSPQTLAQLSDADTDLEKSFNVVPFRQVAVRPDSQIYMLLKNLARKLLMLPQERTQFGAAVFEHGILQNVCGAGAACLHPCGVPHRIGQPLPPDAGRGVFVYSGAPYRGTDAGAAGKGVFRLPGTYCPGIQTPDRADGAPLYRKGAVRPLLHPHRAGAAHHRGVQDQRLWRLQPLFPRL